MKPSDFIETPDAPFGRPEGYLMVSDALEHLQRHVAVVATRLSSVGPEGISHEKLQEHARALRGCVEGLADVVRYLRGRGCLPLV